MHIDLYIDILFNKSKIKMGNVDSNASIKAMHANYIVIRNIKEDSRYGEGRIVK